MSNNFFEKTLEEIIYSNKDLIHEKGIPKFYKKTLRQFTLPSGKISDLFSFEINNDIINFNIYELKRKIIDENALIQAYNYLNEIIELFGNCFLGWDAKMILIGKEVRPIKIRNILDIQIETYIYDYGLDGISFKKIDAPDPRLKKGISHFCGALYAINSNVLPAENHSFKQYPSFIRECPNLSVFLRIASLLNCSFDDALEYVKSNESEAINGQLLINGVPLTIKKTN